MLNLPTSPWWPQPSNPLRDSLSSGAKAPGWGFLLVFSLRKETPSLFLSHSNSFCHLSINHIVSAIMGPLWCWMLKMLRWINHRHSLPVTPIKRKDRPAGKSLHIMSFLPQSVIHIPAVLSDTDEYFELCYFSYSQKWQNQHIKYSWGPCTCVLDLFLINKNCSCEVDDSKKSPIKV